MIFRLGNVIAASPQVQQPWRVFHNIFSDLRFKQQRYALSWLREENIPHAYLWDVEPVERFGGYSYDDVRCYLALLLIPETNDQVYFRLHYPEIPLHESSPSIAYQV